MKIFLTLLFCSSTIIAVQAQELKQRKKRTEHVIEEYTVLASDKTVKHGKFISYPIRSTERRAYFEIGSYKENKRSGRWYFFNNVGNFTEEGGYSNGNKQGVWIEYHASQRITKNSLLNRNTDDAMDLDSIRSVSVKSAEGVYHLDEKVGAWNYFSKEGGLMQKYDHSSNRILVNNVSVSQLEKCPYIGGCLQFIKELKIDELNVPKVDSHVVVEVKKVNSDIVYKLESSSGYSKMFIEIVSILKDTNELFVFDYLKSGEKLLFKVDFNLSGKMDYYHFDDFDSGSLSFYFGDSHVKWK